MKRLNATDMHGNYKPCDIGYVPESGLGEIQQRTVVKKLNTEHSNYINLFPQYKSGKLGEKETSNNYSLLLRDVNTEEYLTIKIYSLCSLNGARVLYPLLIDNKEHYPIVQNGIVYYPTN